MTELCRAMLPSWSSILSLLEFFVGYIKKSQSSWQECFVIAIMLQSWTLFLTIKTNATAAADTGHV
jgi:hypothetical protein